MVTVDTKNYPYYNFPPFYTYFFESKRVVLSPFGYRLQETSILINQQLDTWCKIIKEYYTDRKNMFIDLKPYELDVFNNTSINRKAEEKLIKAIFDNLVMQSYGYWKDETTFVLRDKTYDDWATLIYEYVKKNVLYIDEVYAVDELLTDFKYTDAPFYRMDKHTFVDGLKSLQRQGKAKLFRQHDGVKFFK